VNDFLGNDVHSNTDDLLARDSPLPVLLAKLSKNAVIKLGKKKRKREMCKASSERARNG